MDYSLAKELKDVGFPQEITDADIAFFKERGEEPPIKDPTLEELIEACGYKFFGLRRFKDKWEASAKGAQIQNQTTPTEAVARLWLALNKKA